MTQIPCTTEAEHRAEQDLVGIALRWPERVREVDVPAESFADPRWRTAWRTVLTLDRDQQPIDALTVAAAASKAGAIAIEVEQLNRAAIDVVTGTNVGHYAELVRGAHVRRELAQVGAEVVAACGRHDAPGEVLSEALRRVSALALEQESATATVYSLLKTRYQELTKLAEAKGRGEEVVTGVPSGIPRVDKLCGGFQRGIATVVAGRPGMGKSSFALTCVQNATARGVGCHVFSLEDTRQAYCDRVISGASGIAAEKLRTLDINREDVGRMSWAMGQFRSDTPWLYDDRSAITADEVVRTVRRHASANKTELVVVDYVTLLRPPRDVRRGEEAVTYAMNVLADAAKHDGMAYLVLAQLNRECERRDNKRPMLSDLKQAGTIEERAKAVLFLYRPAVYAEVDERKEPIPEGVLEILVAKNSQGRTGCAMATWDGATMRVS